MANLFSSSMSWGICRRHKTGRFFVCVSIGGKRCWFGSHATLEEAVAAREQGIKRVMLTAGLQERTLPFGPGSKGIGLSAKDDAELQQRIAEVRATKRESKLEWTPPRSRSWGLDL